MLILYNNAYDCRAHKWLMNLASLLTVGDLGLTIDPGDADGLEDGHEEETHAAGSVVVEELEHVHPPLVDTSR